MPAASIAKPSGLLDVLAGFVAFFLATATYDLPTKNAKWKPFKAKSGMYKSSPTNWEYAPILFAAKLLMLKVPHNRRVRGYLEVGKIRPHTQVLSFLR